MMRNLLKIALTTTIFATLVFAQGYKKPPKDILDILDAPATPATSVSPAKDKIAMLGIVRYRPVADYAQPMLKLAGTRVNPNTNSDHRQGYYDSLTLKNISDGKETKVALPAGARIVSPNWSADGKYLAAGNMTDSGVELWVIETATAKAFKLNGVMVNTAFGGFDWMPDQKSLLVNMIPQKRGAAPAVSGATIAPSIQETSGRAAAIRTYQDLLTSPNDEKLFDYYATSQLAVVGFGEARKGGKSVEVATIGKPAIFLESDPSPNGKYILTSTVKRPYSYQFPIWSFPSEIEVWDRNGAVAYKVASVPLQDNLPDGGVTTSRRSVDWIPTEASTLMWAEALDGGDPSKKVSPRDQLMTHQVPTRMAPREVVKIEQRYSGRLFGEDEGMMWFYDYDRDTRKRRIFMTDYRNTTKVQLVSDLNVRDRYNDIGTPVFTTLPNGKNVVLKDEEFIFLSGRGASPEGDRPFLRRMNLNTLKTEEMFRSSETHYESLVSLLDNKAERYITQRESENDPPNLFIRDRTNTPEATKFATSFKQITDFKDPAPQLRGIQKKLVKYKRADGVDLSFTLYLPPNYKEGTRLPALLWAYPLEYTNANVAGQVSGSTNRFTSIGGISHLFLLTQGYAILNDATVPIVGDPLTVNDTFIEQLVAGAKAAVDKGAEMGVIDPDRVAVGGHSYGAFMTAHLLANSDIFRAGIARSGAYNRTLTPFGFQSERRTFWEAPESYYTLSPFMRAHKINEPMLMTHGEEDNNSGTYPMQSERMFAAIQGNGGTARLVMLPHESHGYSARESVEHVQWEQIQWMDKYVKNARPRTSTEAQK